MASSLSTILKALSVGLTDWAESLEPVAGVVTIAADEDEGLDMLGESPKGWRLVLWANGETPKAATSDELVTTAIRIGLSATRGMRKQPGKELIEGRGNLPPILEMIEGTVAMVRGMHTQVMQPDPRAEGCWLLRYRGWEWVRFLTGVGHFTAQMNFTLDRQVVGRGPMRIIL